PASRAADVRAIKSSVAIIAVIATAIAATSTRARSSFLGAAKSGQATASRVGGTAAPMASTRTVGGRRQYASTYPRAASGTAGNNNQSIASSGGKPGQPHSASQPTINPPPSAGTPAQQRLSRAQYQ